MEKPGLSRPGLQISERPQAILKTKRPAQVHDAAIAAAYATGGTDVTRTIHYTELGAKDIRVGNAPARMVEKVTETGEELQPHSLPQANVLEDRCVPAKRVSIAYEKNLPETARCSVRQDKRGIGATVGANQALINREELCRRGPRAIKAGERNAFRVEEFLNLLQRDSGRKLNPAYAGIVSVIDRRESTS